MRKLHRTKAPDWLLKNAKNWGNQYAQKRSNPKKRNDFQWVTYKKQKVNLLLLPVLNAMTQNHCAFCDSAPLVSIGAQIEYFEPVSTTPEKAYLWENLFYCCQNCNAHKNDAFDDLLLKPDESYYDFSNYFIFDFLTGELSPNPAKTVLEQTRALKTIELYGLNEYERPFIRLREIKRYQNSIDKSDLNDFQFRFIFEFLSD
jgi:uncharacterized protein (TIGR02646 family)